MRLLATIWLIAILAQAFSKDLIILNYQLNIRYIVSHLCVNRDKPQLHCDGKCFLKKQLEKDQRHDATHNTTGKFAPDVPYCDCYVKTQAPLLNIYPFRFRPIFSSTLHPSFGTIFHPPAIA